MQVREPLLSVHAPLDSPAPPQFLPVNLYGFTHLKHRPTGAVATGGGGENAAAVLGGTKNEAWLSFVVCCCASLWTDRGSASSRIPVAEKVAVNLKIRAPAQRRGRWQEITSTPIRCAPLELNGSGCRR